MNKKIEPPMVKTKTQKLGRLKVLFKLLSEEVRIRILCLLSTGELNVSEIQQILKIKQSNLSSHLNQLKENQVLISRREGQHSYYRLVQYQDIFFVALIDEVLTSACKEPWYAKDQKLRAAVMHTRQANVLEYFQSAEHQNTEAPGQVIDILSIGFLNHWSSKRVVDLGCGTGRITRLYALAGAKVSGVDLSSMQIRQAKQIDKKLFSALPNEETIPIRYFCENMEATSLQAAKFDLVIISHALHHAPEPSRALREAYRLLTTGGEILIIDLDQHHNEALRERFGDFWLGFEQNVFKGWLAEIGFELLYYKVLRHYICEEKVFPFIVSARKK